MTATARIYGRTRFRRKLLALFAASLVMSGAVASPVIGQGLRDALIELNSDGAGLMFSSETVKAWMRVEVVSNATDPLSIARDILRSHGLGLAKGPGDRWLVVRAPAEEDARIEIKGQVIDADTGIGIASAVLLLNGQHSLANNNGYFVVRARLPAALEVSAEGYEPRDYAVDEEAAVEIPLRQLEPQIDELTVTTSRYTLFEGDDIVQLSHEEINRLPHLADDVARAIARVPAAAANDFSARFSLRGGWPDEATIRLDGLDLPDPFHLKDVQGAFSIVDSNLVRRVDVLPGSFGAAYGNSASGIVDISTITADDGPVYGIGVSFVNLYANGRDTFNDGQGSWLVSARRGYMDWVFDRLETSSGEFAPRFSDLFLKVEHAIGDRHALAVQALVASDDFEFRDDPVETVVDSSSDSRLFWVRLNSNWNSSLVTENILWRNEVHRNRNNLLAIPEDMTATLVDQREGNETGIRTDWRWRLGDSWQLRFGGEVVRAEFDYDHDLVAINTSPMFPNYVPIDRRIITTEKGSRTAFYATATRRFRRLTAELGWRWDSESYTGLDEHLSSPRLALRYELSDRARLWASWGEYGQFQSVGALQVEDGVEQFYPATRSVHSVVGIEVEPANTLMFRAEAYSKRYTHVRPRFSNSYTPFLPIPEASQDRILIAPTSAEAVGIELSLKQSIGRFAWQGSYTLADVYDRIDGVDVPRDWTQRHAVSTIFNWEGVRWNFNLAARWHSGWPLTEAFLGTVDTPSGPQVAVVPGERNAARNDNYLRVDARVSRTLEFENSQFSFFFEVYNLFDTENSCCIESLFLPDGSDLIADIGLWLPRIPSFGFSWTFQ